MLPVKFFLQKSIAVRHCRRKGDCGCRTDVRYVKLIRGRERNRLLPRRSAERFQFIHCAYVGAPYRATGANRHSFGGDGAAAREKRATEALRSADKKLT
jgi:hypothetical protein